MLWTPLNPVSGNSFPKNTYLSFHPLLCYSRHWKHIRKVYVMFKASSGSFRCRKIQTGLLNHLFYQNTSWREAPNYLELSVLVWAWTDEDYTEPNCPFTPPLRWYNITHLNTIKRQMSGSAYLHVVCRGKWKLKVICRNCSGQGMEEETQNKRWLKNQKQAVHGGGGRQLTGRQSSHVETSVHGVLFLLSCL